MSDINYKSNCLNTIRLLAAFQVIYDHAVYYLKVDINENINWIVDLFHGVPIFFTMSGFLIWFSIGSSKNYLHYLKKRFWRIYPELWFAVIIEMITILILYKEFVDYPKLALFAITQGTFLQFWTPDFLRGFGSGTPNGALWCICVLIQFYLIAYPLYQFLHKRKARVWLFLISITVLIGCMTPVLKSHLPIISKLYGQTILPYLWMFLIAAFASEKKESILPILKKYWWLLLIILFFIRLFSLDINASYYSYGLFETICLFGGLMGFAYTFPNLNFKYDFSYGLYIYHSIILNIFIEKELYYNPIYLFAVFLISSIIAYFSMISVGKISKKMKTK